MLTKEQVQGKTGIVPNFINDADLDSAIKVFQTFAPTEVPNGISHGVTPEHQGYLWFNKIFMKRLYEKFGSEFKLVFAMYMDLTQPFGIHSDLYHLSKGRQPFVSCLIPCSVNHDPLLTYLATTDVYAELDHGQPPPENPTLLTQTEWKRGDLIWWDTRLFHTGGTFDGFDSKQSIVIHLYV